jgi:galactose mutarotase-like enzyme
MLNPRQWTRDVLEKHSLDMRQFVGFRSATLPNGTRIVEAYNAAGLNFTILPDRGLDIWTASYKGLPLTWVSPGSPHPPDDGMMWLRQFNGGLLVTCGLTHVGPPEVDDKTGESRDLHGNATRLRAGDVAIEGRWNAEDRYVVTLKGAVHESRLFGEQMRLERTYTLQLDSPVIQIDDTVTNIGDEPVPFMILYHFNVGFPLIQQGTRLMSSGQVYARNEQAMPGLPNWPLYNAPSASYLEQVFFHHVHADTAGYSVAALNVHGEFGFAVRWRTTELPYLSQWKNTRQGIVVCGVEPGNCLPEGQNAARKNGRLVMLQPGESQSFATALEVLDGGAAVQTVREEIESLSAEGRSVVGCKLP